jgi:hypothetical protein
MDLFVAHTHETYHYTSHIEAVTKVRNLIEYEAFQGLLATRFGKDANKFMKEYLNSVSNPMFFQNIDGFFDGLAQEVSRNMYTMMLGYNLKSIMRQIPAFLLGGGEIPPVYIMNAFWESKNLPKFFQTIDEKSSQFKARYLSKFERDSRLESRITRLMGDSVRNGKTKTRIMDGLARNEYFANALRGFETGKQIGMEGIQAMDQYMAGIVWYGAYQQAINGKVRGENNNFKTMSEVEAIEYADMVMNRTQQTAFTKDLPMMIQKLNGMGAFYRMFMGPALQNLGRFVHETGYYALYGDGWKKARAFGTIMGTMGSFILGWMLINGSLWP